MRVVGPCLVALLVAVAPERARAEGACGAEVLAWSRDCLASHSVLVEAERCDFGRVVVRASSTGGDPVRVEISEGRGGFRRAGGLALSPIAEISDWSRADATTRAAFDGLAACVAARTPPSLTSAPDVVEGAAPDTAGAVVVAPPWLLLGGLASSLAGLLWAWRRRGARALLVIAGGVLASAFLTFAARRLLVPPSFFHQNGQGPSWIGHALCDPSSYGPGMRELFGWVARLAGSAPDGAVFLSQSLLAALLPAAGFLLARAAGARSSWAVVAGLALALDPGLARLAGSESYYAAGVSLLVLAAASLAAHAWGRRVLDGPLLLGALGAGLLVAQAARLHPVCWLPAALTPLSLLVARGPLFSRRLPRFVLASAVVGVVALLAAHDVVRRVLQQGLGETSWLELVARTAPRRVLAMLPIVAPAAIVATLLARDRRQGAARALVFAAIACVPYATDLIATEITSSITHAVRDVIHEAGYALYLPALLPSLFAVLAGLGVSRRAAWMPVPRAVDRAITAALLVLTLAAAGLRYRADTAVATDALEADFLLSHREKLEAGGTFVWLGRAEWRVADVPVYGPCAGHPARRLLTLDQPVPDLAALRGPVYYYRSSLCSTAAARAFCDALEARYTLEPLDAAELPVLESMRPAGYSSPVRVQLFRLRGP